MKKLWMAALCAALLVSLLAACGKEASEASAPQDDTPSSEMSQLDSPNSVPEPDSEPGNDSVDEARLQEIYDALAAAAGLEGTVNETETDLAAVGVTVDNIEGLIGRRSIIGGDSGLVLVMQVAPGTADSVVKELENYRDAYLSGANYEEFADSQAAMAECRIKAYGDIVVYVSASAAAGAEYATVDAALAEVFG